jgi:uncharacterized protein (DUF1919 family)
VTLEQDKQQNKLNQYWTNDIKPVGELTDVEIAAMRDRM